jgi:hypothetical protein
VSGGRFDWRYELDSIHRGMDRELHQTIGQIVPWFVYDPTRTVVDDIYDVASSVNTGRVWKPPVSVAVLNAIKLEANAPINQRGLYTVDTLQVIISPDALRLAGLSDVIENPNVHVVDRIVYENKVFDIEQIRVRGVLQGDYSYAVVGLDARQVKREELVNDLTEQWSKYIPLDRT